MKIPFKAFGAMGAVATAALLSACSEGPVSVTQPFDAPSFHLVPVTNPTVELMAICKVGPPGTYTFQADATHPVLWSSGTTYDLTSSTYNVTVTNSSTINVGGSDLQGACTSITNVNGTHNHVALAGGTIQATVTVAETTIPAGIQFVKVETYQKTGGSSGPTNMTSSTTNSASVNLGGTGGVASTLMGGNVVFYNEPEEGEFAGCTPGFWKQSQHFQYWTTYAPTDKIGDVFSEADGYTTAKGIDVDASTLLQGLNFGGGPTAGDAAAILLRAAISGLLNAASPDVNYYVDVATLISNVNAALATGNRQTMLTLAGTIDAENNRGCTAKD